MLNTVILLWLLVAYVGRPLDPVNERSVAQMGIMSWVVNDVTWLFSGCYHVIYMDIFFTCGPQVEQLAEDNIFVAGTTINERTVAFS